MKAVVLSLLLALPLFARAGEPVAYAYVSALQPPAWVEQNGQRTALTATSAIVPGRHYSTGNNGRLHIAMADGSIVKLGENAVFELPALQLRQDGADNTLKGALRIIKGAFRYTAQALNFIKKRELDIYVGPTITIGIRGTDVWGKSDPTQDLACLLQGKIKISSPKQPEVTMDQANSFYVVPHNQAPNPVAPVPLEKLKTWIPQTELDNSRPALQSNGAYSVLLAVYIDEAHANKILSDINEKGYPAVLHTEKRSDGVAYSLVIEGLSSALSAAAFAEAVKGPLYLKNPRVLGPG